MNKIPSPLSFSDNTELIKTFSAEEIINRWKKEFDIDIDEEFIGKSCHFSLYKCHDSGLLFFEPSIAGSGELYKKLQRRFEWYYMEEKRFIL